VKKMLFMAIYTVESENAKAFQKRVMEQGIPHSKGVKINGQWPALTGGKAFQLIDVDDPQALLAITAAWDDLCNIEYCPVMPAEEVMKFLSAKT
jgi:hypothetical protein